MPATQLFAMIRASKRVHAREMMDAAEIAQITVCRPDYAANLMKKYEAKQRETHGQLPPKAPGPVLKWGDPTAKQVMRSIAKNVMRAHGIH